MKGRAISRSRSNQPRGYKPREHASLSPTNHMCVKHNYVYYPCDWTDSSSGQSYRKGYYDENGVWYENVIFKQYGRYSKVPCRCQYCGVTTTVDMETEEALLCKQCGAPLEIQAALDEYTQDPLYTRENPQVPIGKRIGRFLLKPWVIVLLIFLIAGVGGAIRDSRSEEVYPVEEVWTDSGYGIPSNDELFGEQIRLDMAGDGTYVFSPEGAVSCDKTLEWIDEEGFFYDADSDCWLDFNTDMDPAIWQYWYEGISSDFGDCGWMEYEDGVWYVEASPGYWTELPARYDRSRLWHLEGDFSDLF